jgi:hypothetical protein
MTNLVELEEKLLAHDLERAHFACIFLLRQIYLSIATLPDLRQNLEVALPQPCTSLPEVGSLAPKVLRKSVAVFCLGGGRRRRVLGFELREPALASMDIGEEVVVVVEEIWQPISLSSTASRVHTYTVASRWPGA